MAFTQIKSQQNYAGLKVNVGYVSISAGLWNMMGKPEWLHCFIDKDEDKIALKVAEPNADGAYHATRNHNSSKIGARVSRFLPLGRYVFIGEDLTSGYICAKT